MEDKPKRPNIPNPIQLKLWVLAAGRCEFQGCNNFLLREDLTLSEGNYSNIAHIISWTPTGPRGDVVLSHQLAKDIGNLMLMCPKHAKLIDIKENIPYYTVDKLRMFKKQHEDRVRIQTEIQEERKTLVLRLESNIRGRRVQVPQADAHAALIEAGRYPVNDRGVLIDLTGIEYSPKVHFWNTSSAQIDAEFASSMRSDGKGVRYSHISIFALAPIPLLVYLGYRLGNTIPADVYIKPRGKNWLLYQNEPSINLTSKCPECKAERQVALSIAISGTPSQESIEVAVNAKLPIYEIKIQRPAIDLIQSKTDLEIFRKLYRSLIDEIREKHGKETIIHLFAAIPICVAVVCGMELLHGVDPSFLIYEHGFQKPEFFPAIKIN